MSRLQGTPPHGGWPFGAGRLAALAVALLALLPGVVLLEADTAKADSATVVAAALPTGRAHTSAAWDGTAVFVFGGWDGSLLKQIVRYDPTTDSLAIMGGTLPSARFVTSAVWGGTHAYIFGGHDGSSSLNQIVRYDPATDTVATMSATLPTGRHATSAVWDGTNAYIFGGNSDGSALNQIVRYDPATDTVTTMSATLPTARRGTSAAWDGTNAYIFGGFDGSRLDQIVRYDPAADTVANASASLPTRRYQTSAAWDGTNAYIFGGNDNSNANLNLDEIVRYSLAALTPVQAIQLLLEDVEGLDASDATKASLSGPLGEAEDTLADENPNNDGAACGKLQAFLHQVEAKRNNGHLTDAQADALAADGEAIRAALGC